MHDYIHRLLTKEIEVSLEHYPVTALLGPRQCGKSTLSKRILEKIDDTTYLDLELPSDLGKMSDPELFLRAKTTSLVCIDEIQRLPDLFPVLRALVDESQRKRRFLILGSASPDLIRQSSETLAGRINYLELTPLRLAELANTDPNTLWIRGGFPDSYLASVDDLSLGWRENFIRTFLERDLAQMDVRLPATTMRRFWGMLAHLHGQTINYSKLGQSLDLSHTTIKRWLDVLEQTFMIRTLPPMESNLKKRLVKSPKVYIRDSGLLHALLEIETFDHLMGHPIVGASWEGFCVETLVSSFTKGRFSFFRTTSGQEVDCIYERKDKRIGFEIKLSSAPKIARGTYSCVGDLNLTHLFVISPVGEAYPLSKDITVADVLTVVDRVERLL
jgi:hypothetical protein